MRSIGQIIIITWFGGSALLLTANPAAAQTSRADRCGCDPAQQQVLRGSPFGSSLSGCRVATDCGEACRADDGDRSYETIWESDWPLACGPSDQKMFETEGCSRTGDTIWFDALPEDCASVGGTLPEESDSRPGARLRRRGRQFVRDQFGEDPNPDAQGPIYCDEADVGPDTPWDVSMTRWWTRDLSFFAGVHGFKGPFDQGRNGNFGFHEGLNFGAPLGLFDWGWQVGAQAVHSNLSGDRTFEPRSSDRNQYFFTTGLFRRARDWGCQWGVTYDWLHDAYYAKADLKQIRSDSSLLLPGGLREIGYFGAYGMGGTNFVLVSRELKYLVFMEPTDIFAFYYRRYFSGGGDGRIWAGWSGRGDGLLGGEIRVPMGTSWALENRANYLIPKQGRGADGAIQESWGVTLQLVWYPGHPARCERYHPYRPMLNVADNTLFMTDTFVPPGVL